MSDPLERLRLPIVPIEPGVEFAEASCGESKGRSHHRRGTRRRSATSSTISTPR